MNREPSRDGPYRRGNIRPRVGVPRLPSKDPESILTVFGTRPEAIKLAPLIDELRRRPKVRLKVCVTGQHREMLHQVLGLFGIVPDYDVNLMQKDQALPHLAASILDSLTRILQSGRADFYQWRFSNEINPVSAKLGLKPSWYFQPYIGLRFSRDVRSVAGGLPQIFSDNSAVISFGAQSASPHIGVVLYAEAGAAVNLIGARPIAASDYRVGAVWFRSWGTGLYASGDSDRSFSPTGSAHSDGGFYSRYKHNVIGNLQLREGFNLPGARMLPMQLLGAITVVKDTNGNFYNNVVEVGPVLRIAPFRHLTSLSFEGQYLHGFYYVHDPTNPYHPRYGDLAYSSSGPKRFRTREESTPRNLPSGQLACMRHVTFSTTALLTGRSFGRIRRR